MAAIDILRNNLMLTAEFAANSIRDELAAQGHRASGKTEKAIRTRVTLELSSAVARAEVLVPEHVMILDKGVRASRVPFGGRSGGRESRYIQKLLEWSRDVKPSMTEKDRKSFVFAIAHTAKKEGHPTRGSFRFSSNGRRTNWSEHAIRRKRGQIKSILNLTAFVSALIQETVLEFKTS